jgi:hypothetical protein
MRRDISRLVNMGITDTLKDIRDEEEGISRLETIAVTVYLFPYITSDPPAKILKLMIRMNT